MNKRDRKRQGQAQILNDVIHKSADRLWDALGPIADAVSKADAATKDRMNRTMQEPKCRDCWHWFTTKLFQDQQAVMVTGCTNWDGEEHRPDDVGCTEWRSRGLVPPTAEDR